MSSSIGVQESSTLPRLPMESYLCMFGLSQTIGMTYLVSHTKTQSSYTDLLQDTMCIVTRK